MQLFVQSAFDNPQYYFAVIISVVISIVLHELAHGWAAISRGDRTPIELGHITLNPLVHMGGFAMAALFLVGISWGMMPVNPSRMKGKYAGAFVAFAGPLMNLGLAGLGMLLIAVIMRLIGQPADGTPMDNLVYLLTVFAVMNLVLFMFNLIPIPPLDGSRILADLVPAYRNFLSSPAAGGVMMAGFFFVFLVAGRVIFPAAFNIFGLAMGVLLP